MKKYSSYMLSHMKWNNTLPAHWNIQRLKLVLQERKENNFPIKTDNILSLTNTRGVIPYAEKGNIGNKSKENIEGCHIAQIDDLVINSMNVVIGSAGVSKYFGAISPVYYALYPRNGENIHYFEYIFKLSTFEETLKELGNGILDIRKRIPMIKLNNVVLPVPPRKEQDQIVRFLDWKVSEINRLINIKKKEILLLKEKEKNLISEAVLHGLRKTNYKLSGNKWLGDIPDSWEIIKLGNFCTFQNGISESGDFFTAGTPFVSYGDVYRHLELPKRVKGMAKSNEQQQRVFSVKKGDILFTRTSENIEEIGMAAVCKYTIEKAVFSGFIIRCRPKEDVVDTDYMKYYLQIPAIRNHFSSMMNIVIRASLSQNLLKQMPVVIPPMQEQKEIATYLESQHAKHIYQIEILEKEINVLNEYKTRLIFDTVTGQIDIRDIDVPEYEFVGENSIPDFDGEEISEESADEEVS
ncbi:MAG: restriction endonuclease subunit S [Lachnospiraceae bacterium]|nr:restriction endonuclease subunit S [Lachnospiraceae bacterium]